jgi:hypothetical protein
MIEYSGLPRGTLRKLFRHKPTRSPFLTSIHDNEILVLSFILALNPNAITLRGSGNFRSPFYAR